ncbi:aldo/keto reductase [Ascoidea rubescens DSM 1968]|uniref:Aldo/keto reductase n=1 Tax=Ascoidea rubescens DSM 1968 TaxID=1344418 RepID=A0A1D2VPM1_9ASCO|nr:Aldo/keto reductase [Ascoidea rubescens DSM 1968]ODV63560.1 Aldo/keto reductase [Ascoidea rubescens DSM 1968]
MTSVSSTIPFTTLGNSGLKISKVIVGCMSFGKKSWAPWVVEDEEECLGILKRCYDLGMRTFDTADMYSHGYSEIILGKFIKKYNIKRDRIVIMTKVFHPVDAEDPNFSVWNHNQTDYMNSKGLSRKHIFDAIKNSMERLGTYIDVYQIHRLDHSTPPEEIMKALNDCIEQGYTRYIGASSMKTYEFQALQNIAEKNNWFKFISMQNLYNLLYREEEREMIPYCNKFNVGVIPWSPNARGLLARPLKTEKSQEQLQKLSNLLGLVPFGKNDEDIINRVEELSRKKNCSMAQIALAWLISKNTCPIVGMGSIERIEDTAKAFNLELTDEEISYLEELYSPKFAHI